MGKRQTSLSKIGHTYGQILLEEEIQMTNKNMKTYLRSLIIREMQSKPRYHNSPCRLDNVQRDRECSVLVWVHGTPQKLLSIVYIYVQCILEGKVYPFLK